MDFSKKVVCVYTQTYSLALWSPSLEEQAGRVFLVGKGVGDASNPPWFADGVAAIPWDLVTCYLVFESEESYHEARRASASGQPVATQPKIGLFDLFPTLLGPLAGLRPRPNPSGPPRDR